MAIESEHLISEHTRKSFAREDQTIILASGSAFRAQQLSALGFTVLKRPVVDGNEEECWQDIYQTGAFTEAHHGGIEAIARYKVAAILSQGHTDRPIVAADTAVMICPTDLEGVSGEELGGPIFMETQHKTGNDKASRQQLAKIFTNLGWFDAHRGMYDSLPDGSPKRLYLTNRAIRSQHVRVATSMATYVPQVQTIFSQTSFVDVRFKGLPKDIATDSRVAMDYADSVADAMIRLGKNPALLPGGLDYSLMGTDPHLDRLLGWEAASWTLVPEQDRRDLFRGLPKMLFSSFIEGIMQRWHWDENNMALAEKFLARRAAK